MSRLKSILSKLHPEPAFISLAVRIGCIYVLFMVCQLLFILFNSGYFNYSGTYRIFIWIWGGLVFDTVAILYFNILLILLATLPLKIRYKKWYQGILSVVFVFTNSIALAANIADIFYYPFTLTRTTASVFRQFENESNMGSLFGKFLADYWYGLIIFLLLVALLIYIARKTRIVEQPGQKGLFYYAYAILLLAVTYTLFIGGVRGGYKHSTRPITLSNAGQYVKEPNEVNIVLNTPFCILKTFEIKTFTSYSYYTQTEADSLYAVVHVPRNSGEINGKNVVIIILESFGKEFSGYFNTGIDSSYKSYTPFFDSLCSQSLTFRHSYANGRKSIDIMPSVLASIPSIVEPFILTECFSNQLKSLPFLLRQEGYSTSFFHGAPNGSMGYLAFSNMIGIDRYYGLDEYGNKADFDGYWAIWDEEFFQFFAEKLGELPRPFMSAFFSASSHHPFLLPERYTNKFSEGPHPINRCIGYTDMALRRFFETASKQPWFANTIFVITADHCQSQPQLDIYRSSTGSFEVPVVFYTPDGSLKGKDERLIQQIDIMPVILGQLNYCKPYFAYGNDVLHGKGDNFVVNYINGSYQLFYKDFVLIANDKETTGLFKFKTDRVLQNNLSKQAGGIQDTMEIKLKAFIQQYHNRMLENRISIR